MLVIGSQTFLNKGLEYSADFAWDLGNVGRIEENHHPDRAGNALFQRHASFDAPAGGRRRRHPDAASRAPAAPGRVSAQPPAGSHAAVPGGAAGAARARAYRRGLARRDARPLHRRRFQAPLRLHHLRRRLQGPDALGLSAAEKIPDAVRALRPDQLPRPARRIVVGRARSGDRAEQPHRHGDQRQGSVLRMRQRAGKARAV